MMQKKGEKNDRKYELFVRHMVSVLLLMSEYKEYTKPPFASSQLDKRHGIQKEDAC